MENKEKLDFDDDCIFLKTELKNPSSKDPEFFENRNQHMSGGNTKIGDASINEESVEESPICKVRSGKGLCKEEHENKCNLFDEIKNSKGQGNISQRSNKSKSFDCVPSPTKKREKCGSQKNLVINYSSFGEKPNISSNENKDLETIPDTCNISKHQLSPEPVVVHKRLKLNSIKATPYVADTLKLTHEFQTTEGVTGFNNENVGANIGNYECDAENPVENQNSQYYCQSLKDIIHYEIDKQQTLQMEMLAQQKKFEDLFSAEEWNYLQEFFKLPEKASLLFARMLCRKKHWHRVSKIKYEDISHNIGEVLKILSTQNFFDLNIETESLKLLLELLDKKEIHYLGKIFQIKFDNRKSKKENLIDSILNNCKTQRSVADLLNGNNKSRTKLVKDRVLQFLGTCAKINSSALTAFNRLLLLFSLPHAIIEEDQWNSEIQAMIQFIFKKVCYPCYNVQPTVIFKTRNDFLLYEKAIKLLCDHELAVENKDYPKLSSIGQKSFEEFNEILEDEEFKKRFLALPCYLKKFSAGTVYAKILTSYCERNKTKKDQKELIEVLNSLINQRLFLVVRRGDWYNLIVKAYEDTGKPEKAVEILQLALKDEEINDVQRLVLKTKGLAMLEKKKNNIGSLALEQGLANLCVITLCDPPTREIKGKALGMNERGHKIVYVEESESGKTYSSVEEYAISHYEKIGYPKGIHSEGSIIHTIYFLIFFDIIYGISPPGVFQDCYQKVPLDLYSRSFYLNRKEAIDERLKDMRSWTIDDFMKMIDKIITENKDKNCVIAWETNWDDLYDIVKCLGIESLANICERLVQNFKVYRSGFPDLTVWKPKEWKCMFVEVKSPKDKLSPKQKLWLDFFVRHKIKCEVCCIKEERPR